MTNKTLTEKLENLPHLQMQIGTQLINKIDNIREKYMGLGLCIGGVIGIIGGVIGMYSSYPYENPNATLGAGVFLGTLYGGAFGSNVGLAMGMVYSRLKIKRLEQENPEQAEYIREYRITKECITANNVRPTTKFINR